MAMTREEWLTKVGERTAKLLSERAGVTVPPVYVSVGFPKGHRGRHRAIGQCWNGSMSQDGRAHLFICPTQGEDRVIDILLHEQIHAAVGTKHAHKKEFSKVAATVGLVKPWTATTASEALAKELKAIAEEIGPYPHSTLSPQEREKKGSRLRLFECGCTPPLKLRAGHDEINVTCNDCGDQFEKR